MTTDRFASVIAAIDTANAADPNLVDDGGERAPAALLYGRRMSMQLLWFVPDASEHLRIAARGQHIERWRVPRADFPEGRAGYLAWRTEAARFHARRVGEIMSDYGYDAADCARVGQLLRKERLREDPEVQALEDVACLVFLRHYFADFARGRDPEQLRRIVARTARKMSPEARAAVAGLDLPQELAGALGA